MYKILHNYSESECHISAHSLVRFQESKRVIKDTGIINAFSLGGKKGIKKMSPLRKWQLNFQFALLLYFLCQFVFFSFFSLLLQDVMCGTYTRDKLDLHY